MGIATNLNSPFTGFKTTSLSATTSAAALIATADIKSDRIGVELTPVGDSIKLGYDASNCIVAIADGETRYIPAGNKLPLFVACDSGTATVTVTQFLGV